MEDFNKICFQQVDKKYLNATLRYELRQGLKIVDEIKAKIENLLD